METSFFNPLGALAGAALIWLLLYAVMHNGDDYLTPAHRHRLSRHLLHGAVEDGAPTPRADMAAALLAIVDHWLGPAWVATPWGGWRFSLSFPLRAMAGAAIAALVIALALAMALPQYPDAVAYMFSNDYIENRPDYRDKPSYLLGIRMFIGHLFSSIIYITLIRRLLIQYNNIVFGSISIFYTFILSYIVFGIANIPPIHFFYESGFIEYFSNLLCGGGDRLNMPFCGSFLIYLS